MTLDSIVHALTREIRLVSDLINSYFLHFLEYVSYVYKTLLKQG